MRSARFFVREVDDEFSLALLRDRLRNPFGGFWDGVVAEYLPNVGAYDPVVAAAARGACSAPDGSEIDFASRA